MQYSAVSVVSAPDCCWHSLRPGRSMLRGMICLGQHWDRIDEQVGEKEGAAPSSLDPKALLKQLDEALAEIEVPKEVRKNVKTGVAVEGVMDAAAVVIPGVGLVTAIGKGVAKTEQEMKQWKRDVLLALYLTKTEALEEEIARLRSFMTHPKGFTLPCTLYNVLDQTPPEPEHILLLARSLKYMVYSEFQLLFSEHSYAMGLMRQLPLQQLLILSDHRSWPSSLKIGGGRGTVSLLAIGSRLSGIRTWRKRA